MMELKFDSQMGAIHAALKQAKTTDEKMLVILKYDKSKHTKKIRVFGKTYSWK